MRFTGMEKGMKSWTSLCAALMLTVATIWVPLLASANMGSDDSSESQDPNWVAGKKAVEAQDWKQATQLLSKAALTDPNNADIQNWLGYAQRKQGNLNAAFTAYNQALKLNPNHKGAHEYIGEAYLMAGDVAKAEKHLAELQRLCSPIPCEELKDLQRAIQEYKKKK
jgi:tetratricopeptide (TPR) repeat protein